MNKLPLEDDAGDIDVFPMSFSGRSEYGGVFRPHGYKYVDLPLKPNESAFYSFAYVFLNKHLNQELLY